MTWGLLHGDPAPEAFRWSEKDKTCGLIDWASAVYGPVVYDLASAVMYAGGISRATSLIDSYRDHGLLTDQEITLGLRSMRRFREAVQADYFARRIAKADLTGIIGMSENVKGLHDVRRRLDQL